MGDGGVACAVPPQRAVEGFRADARVRRGGGEAMPDKGEKGHGHHHHHRKHQHQSASAAELEEGELLNGEAENNGGVERTMPPKKWRKVPAVEVEPGEIVGVHAVPSRKARRNAELEKGEIVPERQRKDKSEKSGKKSNKNEVEPGEVAPLEKKRDQDHSRKLSSSAQIREDGKKGSSRDSDEEPGEIRPESSSSGSVRKSRAAEPESNNHKHQAETCDQSRSKSRKKGDSKSSSAGRHLSW